ncbi:MAG: PAS domain-containing sensor histidine kinase, partial [Actinobacteria bacterium]|nr:PAS domain-containing sensor histidine kinase [Actinomycetota bacterium]
MNELAREMYGLVRVLVSRHIGFACHLAPQPILIRANATELRQVVMNLAINAAEAAGTAPVAITLQTSIRRVPRDGLGPGAPPLPRGVYAVLDVVHGGPGMPPESLERAFEPGCTTKGPGRGLGLPAVREIVRSHRGAVWVRSAPRFGTHVRVAIPLATTRARATARRAEPPGPPTRPGALLVVDDGAHLRSLVRRMLERLE